MSKRNPAHEALTRAVNKAIANGAPVYTSQPVMEAATVRWFDNLSQEGMVRLADGSSVYFNNDPVHGHRLMGGRALSLKSGDAVKVAVFRDTTWCQVSKLEVLS